MNLVEPAGTAGRRDGISLRFWAVVLVALYLAFLGILWRRGYYPYFPDFSVFWAAGRLAATGHAAAAYDWASIARFQHFAGWPKAFFAPPLYLIAAAPFGLLPYGVAAFLWLALGLAAYIAATRAILPAATGVWLALAAPPVLFNLMWGQNGLLLAGLLGGALLLLDTRPFLAGSLIALSAFKPQFGIVLPFVLAATGRWRVFAAATIGLLVLCIAAGLIFGWSVWAAFVAAAGGGLGAFAPQGHAAVTMDWTIIGSVYGLLRTIGTAAGVSAAGQATVSAAALAACIAVVRSSASPALKNAVILTAMLAAAPYSEYNDWTLASVALLFLLRDGFAAGLSRDEEGALAGVFLLPLAALVLSLTGLFHLKAYTWLIGPLLVAAMAVQIGRRLKAGR